MRPIDHDGLVLCRMQAEVFRRSAELLGCSSAVFVRRFMNSRVARRMDAPSFLDGATSIEAILEEVEQEYGKSSYGTLRYSGDVLYWMGYLYRYWAYTRQLASARIFRIISGAQLAKLFLPYHSLDPDQAVDRIMEAKGDQPQENTVERGVRLLRAIREKSHFNYAVVNFDEKDE